ncbi:hypothetical protein JHK87_044057 [Glycine soja]|nr:hypothetical protein JHK87_044057 [Glycine soja]
MVWLWRVTWRRRLFGDIRRATSCFLTPPPRSQDGWVYIFLRTHVWSFYTTWLSGTIGLRMMLFGVGIEPMTSMRRKPPSEVVVEGLKGSNSPAVFTIHGLWPDYNDGSWPSCCSGSSFDPKEISTLTNALEQYWPSLSCSKPSLCHGGKGTFWAHEVLIFQFSNIAILLPEKHGTCSYPVFRNEYDYFLTVLNVYFKYNITSVLNDAGYVPSNTEKYPLGGIISAIENAFHASPQIVCSKDSIEELYLCFYKNFQPRDCALGSDIKIDMVTSKKSCPKYVSLPESVSVGHNGLQSRVSDDVAL